MRFAGRTKSRNARRWPAHFAAAAFAMAYCASPSALARSDGSDKKSREEAAIEFFADTCMEERSLAYMLDLARKQSWRELGARELDIFRPEAKRVDQMNGWEMTIAGVPYRLYMSRGSITTKVIADIPKFADSDEFQCRIVTREALSHDALLAILTTAFKRKPDGDFSRRNVTRGHQWGGAGEKEAVFINLITNASGDGGSLIVRWYKRP